MGDGAVDRLFQFTHPCGCDRSFSGSDAQSERFNSRTRVGATHRRVPALYYSDRFQFTHPCGCDFGGSFKTGTTTCFNSRTRVGATTQWMLWLRDHPVSIHAPVWVRRNRKRRRKRKMKFQFTHPCGCDCISRSAIGPCFWFQFTHPCGCDNPLSLFYFFPTCFNSRTRVGATYKQVRNRAVFLVSIHAPVWVRPPQEHGYGWKAGFQFTHPCGCDLPPVIDI